jgi:hypothetical protein
MLYFKEYIVQFWLVPFWEKFIVVTFELFCSVGSRYQMIVGLELWGRLSNTNALLRTQVEAKQSNQHSCFLCSTPLNRLATIAIPAGHRLP